MTTIEAPPHGAYRVEATESTISFTTRHLFGLGRVRGTFAPREGYVRVEDPVGLSTVRVVVAAGSVDTGLAARDDAVRSGRYLDAAAHPDITFTADRVDGALLLGRLTVRGRTEPLTVRVEEVRVHDDRLLVRASAEVDRYAWGVTATRGMAGRWSRFALSVVARRLGA